MPSYFCCGARPRHHRSRSHSAEQAPCFHHSSPNASSSSSSGKFQSTARNEPVRQLENLPPARRKRSRAPYPVTTDPPAPLSPVLEGESGSGQDFQDDKVRDGSAEKDIGDESGLENSVGEGVSGHPSKELVFRRRKSGSEGTAATTGMASLRKIFERTTVLAAAVASAAAIGIAGEDNSRKASTNEDPQKPSSSDDSRLESEKQYDADAMPMVTPRGTWDHRGDQRTSDTTATSALDAVPDNGPRSLSETLRRSMSPVPPAHQDTERKDFETSNISETRTAGDVLTRMLSARVSSWMGMSTTEEKKDDQVKQLGKVIDTPESTKEPQLYVFEDYEGNIPTKSIAGAFEQDEREASPTRIPAPPLSRAPTIIDNTSPSAVSLADSKLPRPVGMSNKPLPQYHLPIKVTPRRKSVLNSSNTESGSSKTDQKPFGDQDGFGGVDGNASEPKGQSVESKNTSIGRGPVSNMSKGLLPSMSMPAMFTWSARRNSFRNQNADDENPVKRRLSLKGIANSAKQSLANIPFSYASSSLYTGDSRYLTPAASHRGSQGQLRDQAANSNSSQPRLTSSETAKDILSVPANNTRTIDMQRLEAGTQTNFLGRSRESLTKSELEAGDQFFVSSNKYLQDSDDSSFVEDLQDVTRVVEATNPVRHIGGYDGGLNSMHSSLRIPNAREDRFSIVSKSNDEATANVWDKALRDHASEDRRLSGTRLGSKVPSRTLSTMSRVSHPPKEALYGSWSNDDFLQPISRSSKDNNLQARLDAYRLPSHSSGIASHRTPSGGAKRLSSAESAWSRYPSHTLEQRSPVSAGIADQVYTRDFAPVSPILSHVSTGRIGKLPRSGHRRILSNEMHRADKKGKSLTFGEEVADRIKGLVRVGSLEIDRRFALESHGYRSSISAGRITEYPELEMLAPGSPAFQGVRPFPRRHSFDLDVKKSMSGESIVLDDLGRTAATQGAKSWSKLYQGCLDEPPQIHLSPVRSDAETPQQPRLRAISQVGPLDAPSPEAQGTVQAEA